jgi:hypothetical protein
LAIAEERDMKRWVLSCVVFAIAISGETFAAPKQKPTKTTPPDRAPRAYGLGSAEEPSWLSFECEFSDAHNQSIVCKFTESSLRLPAPFDEGKFKEDVDQASAADLEKGYKEMCGSLEKMRARLDQRSVGARAKGAAKRVVDACATKDDKDLVRVLRIYAEQRSKTCKIGVNTFELTFKRAGETSWVSDSSPKGLCDASTVASLVRPAQHELWTFTQTRVAVGGTGPLCDPLKTSINKPLSFSWEANASYEADCEFFEYSLF